ncbi:HPP family protein [Cupriavidus sp. D384]|uniref:HPP family protein n=1 Tax=Cupriavidus sp. D384 TaxID=1538095 RepID=UPI00082C5D6F|nr:HPP family protein [Cupriavidus sp. D384]
MTTPSAIQSNEERIARRTQVASTLLAGLGAFVALSLVGILARYTSQTWILGSFGASCVLLFGFPDVRFSRLRNVIGGHLISSAIGLCFFHWLGGEWPAMAAAVSVSLVTMMATDTVHPPAGSNPIIIFLAHPGWSFLIFPTLAGIIVLVLTERLYRRATQLVRDRSQ